MTTPRVTELPRVLVPTTRDTFNGLAVVAPRALAIVAAAPRERRAA